MRTASHVNQNRDFDASLGSLRETCEPEFACNSACAVDDPIHNPRLLAKDRSLLEFCHTVRMVRIGTDDEPRPLPCSELKLFRGEGRMFAVYF